MRKAILLATVLGSILAGCATPTAQAEEPKRFVTVHTEWQNGQEFRLIKDTESGACWFLYYNYPAPAPSNACQ